jgi:hypothetical protein
MSSTVLRQHHDGELPPEEIEEDLEPRDLDSSNLTRSNESVQAHDSLWSPFFLSKSFLAGMFVSFISLMLLLPVLYVYSVHNNGLAKADQSMHYLWTYGPTAGTV